MKKALLKYYLIAVLIGFYELLSAQSFVNIDVAQNFSTFKFSYNILDDDNLLNEEQHYNQISSIAYGIGYTNLRSSGLFFSGGLGFRKAGASLAYKKNSFLWELQYIDVRVGAGYLYNRWIVKPYVYVMPYYAYLLSANQSSGLNYYDIKTDNALKSHDFGLLLNGGVKVPVSYYADIFAEYNYNLGLRNIETATDQYLYNRGFAIKLGLAINLTNFKKAQEQISAGNFNYVSSNDSILNSNSEINPNTTNGSNQLTPASIEGETTDKNTTIKTNSGESNSLIGNDIANNDAPASNSNNLLNKNISVSDNGNQNTTSKTATSIDDGLASNSTSKTEVKDPIKSPVNPTNKISDNKNNLSNQTQSIKNTSSSENEISFKIQVSAVKNPLGQQHPIYKNFKGSVTSEKGKDGWLRYYLGSFESYEEALKELRKAKDKSLIEGGFVVAFKNNKKISVAEAKELLKIEYNNE